MAKTRVVLAGVALTALIGITGCSTIAEPDKVGLYYLEGNSDGYQFDKCIEPGQTGDAEWNNSIVFLPTSLRTWNIAGDGGDSKDPIVVSSKPQPDQPSGVPVNVWSQTNLVLNTFCDKDGGVIRTFWESLGRRYSADTVDGWTAMMKVTVVPALEKATRNVVRQYAADELVANKDSIQAKIQDEIAKEFSIELERLSGGKFFCGPMFNRASKECPPVQLIIKDIDFNDPGIQQARNDKQKAVEQAAAALATAQGQAAAMVAEAKGKSDAAKALATLYANPNWVKLQNSIIAADALVKACEKAKECTILVGADGTLLLK